MTVGDPKHTDREALRREGQRQVTASVVEDFKRRAEITCDRLQDALSSAPRHAHPNSSRNYAIDWSACGRPLARIDAGGGEAR